MSKKASDPDKTLKSKDADSANDEQEGKMSLELEQYHLESAEVLNEFDHLLTTTDQFQVSSDTYFDFKIQDKSFRIRQLLSSSTDTEQKKDPRIWFVDTICPGCPQMVHESLMEPEFRMQWDSQFSSFRKITIDDAFPNIHILHSSAKAAAGGLVAPRDLVDLASVHKFTKNETGYKSIQTVLKSVQREDIPKQKGFVRANVVISGLLFERLSDDEMEKMELPKLMVSDNEHHDANNVNTVNDKECEWTRIRYITETDIKGWIPSKVINAAMSHTISGVIRDLRDFVMYERLALIKESSAMSVLPRFLTTNV